MFDTSFLNAPRPHSVDQMIGAMCGNPELATSSEIASTVRRLDVQDWLPAAAKVYNISRDIRDYVIVPVIIMPTDIPNRNSVAFPYEELLKFNPREGRPSYKTWIGKPTFLEHNNQDHTKAKGIVFDSNMVPIKGTKNDLAKVVCLCGFDTRADPVLAKSIHDRKRTNYSMGAAIDVYECAICGDRTDINARGKRETSCGHVTRGRLPLYKTQYGQKPAYYISRGITGFEVSSVGVPAWASANEDKTIFSVL